MDKIKNILKSKKNIIEIYSVLDVSKETRKDYVTRIKIFIEWLGKRKVETDTFLKFKRHIERTSYSISTKNKLLISAKVFLKELNKKGIIPNDITHNIRLFKEEKIHKRDGLSNSEIQIILEKLRSLRNTPKVTRLKALVSILIFQGLRIIEIKRLDFSDVDLLKKKLLVKGKGKDDKVPIDLHPKTIIALAKYLESNTINSSALFISYSPKTKGQRLSTRGINYIVTKLLRSLKIQKCVHGFRHNFVTNLIKVYDKNLLKVTRFSRHKKLEMLQVYNDEKDNKEDNKLFDSSFGEFEV